MINQDDLLKMWEKDAGIFEDLELTRALIELPKLHSKYLTMYMNTRAEKVMRQKRVNNLSQELDDYYSGNATADVYKERPQHIKYKTRARIEKAVQADERMVKIHAQLEYADILINGLNSILSAITQLNYTGNKLVELEKLRNGLG